MEHAKFTPFRPEDMRILIDSSEVSNATKLYNIDQIADKDPAVPLRVALVTKHPSLAADYEPSIENNYDLHLVYSSTRMGCGSS